MAKGDLEAALDFVTAPRPGTDPAAAPQRTSVEVLKRLGYTFGERTPAKVLDPAGNPRFKPNPWNEDFDKLKDELYYESMMASIEQHGLLNAILVTTDKVVAAGWGRYTAYQKLLEKYKGTEKEKLFERIDIIEFDGEVTDDVLKSIVIHDNLVRYEIPQEVRIAQWIKLDPLWKEKNPRYVELTTKAAEAFNVTPRQGARIVKTAKVAQQIAENEGREPTSTDVNAALEGERQERREKTIKRKADTEKKNRQEVVLAVVNHLGSENSLVGSPKDFRKIYDSTLRLLGLLEVAEVLTLEEVQEIKQKVQKYVKDN